VNCPEMSGTICDQNEDLLNFMWILEVCVLTLITGNTKYAVSAHKLSIESTWRRRSYIPSQSHWWRNMMLFFLVNTYFQNLMNIKE
jgi:hypothetical protein